MGQSALLKFASADDSSRDNPARRAPDETVPYDRSITPDQSIKGGASKGEAGKRRGFLDPRRAFTIF
jgi:hypothetical protein